MRAVGAGLAPGTPVEGWFGDEMRVGRKGTLTRVWAETGARPTAPRADGYQSVYLFGAVCPGRDRGRAPILPRCATAAMALFLDEPGGHVAPGAHAVVVLDGAGWHAAKELRRPATISPLPLPAYSPELNPQERVWALLRQRYLALCAASSITPPCSTPARMRGAGSSASRGASARSAPPPGPPSHDFSGGV